MPWDPMRDLLTMQERLESLFSHSTPGWVPPVDLAEFEDRYVLSVELPGLKRNDVTIEYHEQVLTIRGTRSGPIQAPDRYQQLERGQGAFSRCFKFAVPIARDLIAADLAEGVLTVTVPKTNDLRHIPIVESTQP